MMQALLRSSWRIRGSAAQALEFGVWRPAGGAASTASPSPPLLPPQSELPSQQRFLYDEPLAVDRWLVRGMSSSLRASRPAPKYESLPRSWAVLGGGGAVGQMLVDHLIDSGVDSVKVRRLHLQGRKTGEQGGGARSRETRPTEERACSVGGRNDVLTKGSNTQLLQGINGA
eukprot:366048-Chlamydomonas_euryale.AAC.4